MDRTCYVYWKHLPEMSSWSMGYIGIAYDVEARNKQHERSAYVANELYTVHQMMRKYKGQVVTDVIFEGTREECAELEHELRPEWHMGWNMRPGGEWDERHWQVNPKWLSLEITHPEFGDLTVGPNMILSDIANKYYPESPVSGTAYGLGHMMQGCLTHYRGWTLADPELRQRAWDKVKGRLEGPYYMTNGQDSVKIYANANLRQIDLHFGKARKGGSMLNRVLRGLRSTIYGYSLCSEDDYLANPGPVFGSPE